MSDVPPTDRRPTHLDEAGHAHMVDVSAKAATHRRAVAAGFVRMAPATVAAIHDGGVAKGDALAVARIAAIQGAKRAADLIPLCHPIRLDKVHVDLLPETGGVRIQVEAVAFDRTGVEMEAMAGVSAAALALYDMVKGMDRSAHVTDIRLLRKEGGRSGTWTAVATPAEATPAEATTAEATTAERTATEEETR